MSAKTRLSPLLGPATQLGFVVRDVEAAMRHWIDVFGVGPFICMEEGASQSPSANIMRGQPVMVELKLAFGFMGDVQIELIEQCNDVASPYAEFLAAGREGLQHLGFWVDDYAKATEAVEAAGYKRVYEIPGEPQRPTIYYESPALYGPMLEVISSKRRLAREAIRAATQNWSGGDPIIRCRTYVDFLKDAGVVL